jgi:hypothetical protein
MRALGGEVMGEPVFGYQIGKEVMDALGLQGQRVYAVDIRIATKELVGVTVERSIGIDEAHKLIKVLEKYHLCPLAPLSPAHAEDSRDRVSVIGAGQASGATSSEGPAHSEGTTTDGNASDSPT